MCLEALDSCVLDQNFYNTYWYIIYSYDFSLKLICILEIEIVSPRFMFFLREYGTNLQTFTNSEGLVWIKQALAIIKWWESALKL